MFRPATLTVTARRNTASVEIHCVEAWLQGPLHFQQIASQGTVESALVARGEIGALLCLIEKQMRRVSQFLQCGFDARQVSRSDQQINVAGLAQRYVAIKYLGEGQAFVGQDVDSERVETIEDADEFSS